MNTLRTPKVNPTTSVHLGELKPALLAAAAAAGVGPSTWIRDLVARELTSLGPVPAEIEDDDDAGDRSTAVYRAWLSADLTQALDVRKERDGFKSRAAVIRALIVGVGITSAPSVSGSAPDAAGEAPGAAATLREAVEALGASNHELVGIARNVGNVAKAVREGSGGTRVIDRIRLEEAVESINAHLKVASKLLGDLRPLLKRTPN